MLQPEIFWTASRWPGQIGIVLRPRGGDWLVDEVKAWRTAGVDVVVSLLMPNEIIEFQLETEEAYCQEQGIQFWSLPIADRGVPVLSAKVVKILVGMKKSLESGKNVVVHCRQSIGRSSLIVASVWVLFGEEPNHAFRLIEKARGHTVPETSEQRLWMEKFASEFVKSGQYRNVRDDKKVRVVLDQNKEDMYTKNSRHRESKTDAVQQRDDADRARGRVAGKRH